MPGQRESRVYHIPLPEDMEPRQSCCDKLSRRQAFVICIIPWCFLFAMFGYFFLHYSELYDTNYKCKNILNEKNVNDSVLQAKIGELKQNNLNLKDNIKTLERKLDVEKEKVKDAQLKIDIYVKTIKELKENLNLKISADFLNNNASMHTHNLIWYIMPFLMIRALYFIKV